MLALLVQVLLLCALLLPLLFAWRRLTSSVRNLDGPPSVSFLRGTIPTHLHVSELLTS